MHWELLSTILHKSCVTHFDFRLLTNEENSLLNIDALADKTLNRVLFQANLEYPSEIQEMHNCYLISAEKIKIKLEMLSRYSQCRAFNGTSYYRKISPKLVLKITEIHGFSIYSETLDA